MTILQIPVPEAAAQRFGTLSEQQQTLVSQLVTNYLANPSSLTEIMDFISFKATQRGLTPDILQDLLDEE